MVAGEKGKEIQARAWVEIVDALKKDVPEVEQLARV